MKQNAKLAVVELHVCMNACLWQVSRVADTEETFDDISEYVSLMLSNEQHPSLWQMHSALSRPDVEIPDNTRKQDLPTCPIVSLYGMSSLSVKSSYNPF